MINLVFNSIFNSREIAIIIWLSAILIFCIIKKNIRPSLFGIVQTLFSLKLFQIQFASWCYVMITIYIFHHFGYWNISMLKDSLIWMFITSIIIAFNSISAKENYFKNLFFDSIKLIVIIEFILNLFPFSLFGELIFLPSVTILVLMKYMAEKDEKTQIVSKFLDWVFFFLSIFVIVYCLRKAINDFRSVVNYQNFLDLIMPIYLTISFIPFAYIIHIYSEYEQLFTWLNYRLSDKDKKLVRYLKYQTILKAGVNLKKLELVRSLANRTNANSREEIDREIIKKLI